MERSSKMEFFRKLGYGSHDVVRVLDKLGQDALVNDVLQELIQTGSRPREPEASDMPRLVPRGCGAPACAPLRLGANLDEDRGGPSSSLRPIVIDGSNVAMSHGNKEAFSCRGIQLAVDWFKERGHTYIKVFVPSWRRGPPRSDSPIREQHVLEELERQGVLVYTPSRKVNGKRVVCYDDRYIVKVAYEQDGVIVSNDNYRDLQSENPEWKWFIEQRLLMFSFVNDRFMPPDDPLGRRGPTLSNFLSRKPKPPEPSWQHCPYGKKCTYGIKCKFYHPERPQRAQLAVADELRAQTRAWRGAGATEEAQVRGAPSLPPGLPPPRGAADVATLESRLSRALAFGDDPADPPACAPNARCPDGSLVARSTLPRLGSSSRPSLPLQPGVGGSSAEAPHQRRPPVHPWAPSEGAEGFLDKAAWAEASCGDGALEVDTRAQARALLCRVFPPQQVDRAMALSPVLSDVPSLVVLIQRLPRADPPVEEP